MTNLRILVVEDNPDAARTLGLLLSRKGYQVQVAHTGPAGVKAAQEWGPEVVLCDIGLPGMDGFEVASVLRRGGVTARLIAITAYGDMATRGRAYQSGFDFLLIKPADLDLILRLLPRTELPSIDPTAEQP